MYPPEVGVTLILSDFIEVCYVQSKILFYIVVSCFLPPHISQITFQSFERSVPWARQGNFFFYKTGMGKKNLINLSRVSVNHFAYRDGGLHAFFTANQTNFPCHFSLRQVTSRSCFNTLYLFLAEEERTMGRNY